MTYSTIKFFNKKTSFAILGVFVLFFASFATLLAAPSMAQTPSPLPSPQLPPSAGPNFNIFQPYTHNPAQNQDEFLLDVRNDTKGQTLFNFPASADRGDILTFRLYYHNGVTGTVANNTTLQVNLPNSQNSQHIISAKLFADNAANATRQNPISQGLPISLSSRQRLTFIPGSVQWFPNHTSPATSASTPLPFGQSGQELFSSGLNIGSIQGCWEFSGAIIFRVRVAEEIVQNNFNLRVDKRVLNLSQNQTHFQDSVNARVGDRVKFRIEVRNNGNADLTNVRVRDLLSGDFQFTSGTSIFSRGFHGNDDHFDDNNFNDDNFDDNFFNDDFDNDDNLFHNDDRFFDDNNRFFRNDGDNLKVNSLASGQTIRITFRAVVDGFNIFNNQTLTNTAFARADQVGEHSDSARVFVSQVNPDIIQNINISKSVRNITAGGNLQNSVNANIGDRVLFLIAVSTPASSGSLFNVRVSDNLPSGLNYIAGTTRVDNSSFGDGLVSGGINLGFMSGSQTKTITFEATVSGLPFNFQTLTNLAFVSADNIGQRSASAQVFVNNVFITPTPTPFPAPAPVPFSTANIFSKRVDNITSPNGTPTDNTAFVGDTLQYTLSFTNNSGATITNAQILDTLPSQVQFISVDSKGFYDSSVNQVIWNIGSLTPGVNATVSYRVRVLNVPQDNFVIANSAAIRSDNFPLTNSNETRTTVKTGAVKGAVIKAVTGGNDMARNIAVSLMAALWGIFFIYLYTEHMPDWNNLRLKFAVWRIKMKEKIS